MENINGYLIHPVLLAALERETPAALIAMRGDFAPHTGCGEDIKKLVDLFAQRETSERAWNELARIVRVEGYHPTNEREMASAVAHVIQVYIFG